MIVPRNTVLQGHVLDKLQELPNDCIDVVVTSTPYYGLRDYGPDCISIWNGKADCAHEWQEEVIKQDALRFRDPNSVAITGNDSNQNIHTGAAVKQNTCVKCGAWKGQLGLEPHPSMFIEHLAQVFLEIKRCLKPSGSLWLNLGDTYFGGNGQYGRPEGWKDLENDKLSGHAPGEFIKERNKLRSNWLQPKQKMMIPARVAIALQDQGWILRNELVWHKINHMPESCRDRLTRSWESVFFFVKSDKYYFDLAAIRKSYAISSNQRLSQNIDNEYKAAKCLNLGGAIPQGVHSGNSNESAKMLKSMQKNNSASIGANPGDVWSLTNEGLSENHYPAFPQKLVKRILSAAAPKEICDQCGKPKTRIVQKNGYIEGNGGHVCRKIVETQHRVGDSSIFLNQACNIDRSFLGWKSCNCGSSFHSAIVFDPFAGSGTVLLVAHKMGYDWSGIELVPKYCDIIEKRIERHGKIRLDGFLQPLAAMAPNDANP